MDYTELLFAAAVRDLAAGHKARASSAYYQTLDQDDSDKKQKQASWNNENPIDKFIPEALAEIQATATAIRTLL